LVSRSESEWPDVGELEHLASAAGLAQLTHGLPQLTDLGVGVCLGRAVGVGPLEDLYEQRALCRRRTSVNRSSAPGLTRYWAMAITELVMADII
jgi:hypothetical protein